MAKKAGIEVMASTNDGADYKGAGTPGAEITDKHKAYFRKMVNGIQSHFTQAVSRGRGLSGDQVKALAGRMFIAEEAQRLGLIDGIRSYEDVVVGLAGAGSGKLSSTAFSWADFPGVQASLPPASMPARSLLGRPLEAAQAALLAACAAEGIQTATQLQVACEDARQASQMRLALTARALEACTEAYGVVERAQVFQQVRRQFARDSGSLTGGCPCQSTRDAGASKGRPGSRRCRRSACFTTG